MRKTRKTHMVLTADIGNSTVSFALFRGKRKLAKWSLERVGLSGVASFRSALRKCPMRSKVEGVCAVSVVPALNPAFREACRIELGLKPLFASPSNVGIALGKYPARSVGADRIVGAYAAYERYGRALVVVDAGSAITFDAVDDRGRFLGGAISPGPELMALALKSMTSRLPLVRLRRVRRVIGRDTRSCISSGIVAGAA
ncbi:MAG TPA: type III pantothenate kinase, partial [bacterium]|nr:type III pantothenate kinase [bacterium]